MLLYIKFRCSLISNCMLSELIKWEVFVSASTRKMLEQIIIKVKIAKTNRLNLKHASYKAEHAKNEVDWMRRVLIIESKMNMLGQRGPTSFHRGPKSENFLSCGPMFLN